jgi:hypothetical protein
VVVHRADAEGAFIDVKLVGFQQLGVALLRVNNFDQLGVSVLERFQRGTRRRGLEVNGLNSWPGTSKPGGKKTNPVPFTPYLSPFLRIFDHSPPTFDAHLTGSSTRIARIHEWKGCTWTSSLSR